MPDQPAASGPRRRQLAVDDYVRGVTEGDVAVLAQTLTLVESSLPRHQQLAEEVLAQLLPRTGNTIRIGITGVPGAGKSTFIESLGLHLLNCGHRVAVLAVDPSSGVSGGSILGDKTRMNRLASQPGAFIRPSPSAGTLGGVARKSRESLLICEAAGFDVILIETVGVGQSETMVANMTDCFVDLVLTGAGDELQGMKRGLLELVDFIVVNKADGENLPAARRTANEYRDALRFFADHGASESNAVFTCSALHGAGIDTIWEAICQRVKRMKADGTFVERRRRQRRQWLWDTVEERIKQTIAGRLEVQHLRDELEQRVLEGEVTVEAATREMLKACGFHES